MSIPNRSHIQLKEESLIVTVPGNEEPIQIPLKRFTPAQLIAVQNSMAELNRTFELELTLNGKTLDNPNDKTRIHLIEKCKQLAGIASSSSSSSSTSSRSSSSGDLSPPNISLLSAQAHRLLPSDSASALVIPSETKLPLRPPINVPQAPLLNTPLPTPIPSVSTVSSDVIVFDNGTSAQIIDAPYLRQAFIQKQTAMQTKGDPTSESKIGEMDVLSEVETIGDFFADLCTTVRHYDEFDKVENDFSLLLKHDYDAAVNSLVRLLSQSLRSLTYGLVRRLVDLGVKEKMGEFLADIYRKGDEIQGSERNLLDRVIKTGIFGICVDFLKQPIAEHLQLFTLRHCTSSEFDQVINGFFREHSFPHLTLMTIMRSLIERSGILLSNKASATNDEVLFLQYSRLPDRDKRELVLFDTIFGNGRLMRSMDEPYFWNNFDAPKAIESIAKALANPETRNNMLSRACRLGLHNMLKLLRTRNQKGESLLELCPTIPKVFSPQDFTALFTQITNNPTALAVITRLSDGDFQDYLTPSVIQESLRVFPKLTSELADQKIMEALGRKKIFFLSMARNQQDQMFYELMLVGPRLRFQRFISPEDWAILVNEPGSTGLSVRALRDIKPNEAWLWAKKASMISLSEEEFWSKCKQVKQLMDKIEGLLQDKLPLVDPNFFAKKGLLIKEWKPGLQPQTHENKSLLSNRADYVPRVFEQLMWFAERLLENIGNRTPLLGTPSARNQEGLKKFYDEMLISLEECLQFITYDLKGVAISSDTQAKSAVENGLNNLLALVSAKTEGRCSAGSLADLSQLKNMLAMGRSETELQAVRTQIEQDASTSTNVNEKSISSVEFQAKSEVKEAKEREIKEVMREEVKSTHQDSIPANISKQIQEVFYKLLRAAIEHYARQYNGSYYGRVNEFSFNENAEEIRALFPSRDVHLIAQVGYLTGLRALPDALFTDQVRTTKGGFRSLNELVKLDLMNELEATTWLQGIGKELSQLDHAMLVKWFEDNAPPSDARIDAAIAKETDAQDTFLAQLASIEMADLEKDRVVAFCSAVRGACLPSYVVVSDKMRDHLTTIRKNPAISGELDRLIDGIVEGRKNDKNEPLTTDDLRAFLKEQGLVVDSTYSRLTLQKDGQALVDNERLKRTFLAQGVSERQLEQVLTLRNEFNQTLQLWANDQGIEFNRNVDGLPSRGLEKQLLKEAVLHKYFRQLPIANQETGSISSSSSSSSTSSSSSISTHQQAYKLSEEGILCILNHFGIIEPYTKPPLDPRPENSESKTQK